jgi:V/A-type H+-transporting ATPase subunit C
MADKYIYAVARIRSLEMSLFSQQTIDQLIAADSYDRALQFLRDQGWGDNDVQQSTLTDMLKYEADKIWDVVEEMVDDMSVFDVIRLPELFHNLKAAIKAVVAGMPPADIFYDKAPIKGEEMMSIVQDKAFERLPENMRECAREAYEVMVHTGDGQMCDAVVDKGTLAAIMKAADKADDSLLKDYAEVTVAVADIKIALRSSLTGRSMDFMRRAMVPCKKLDVNKLAACALAGREEIVKYLEGTDYQGGASALGESSSAFERWCDNRIMDTIKPQKYNPFTVGPIAAYILARQNEIKTVRIIMTCKLNNLSEKAVRERVRDMYV